MLQPVLVAGAVLAGLLAWSMRKRPTSSTPASSGGTPPPGPRVDPPPTDPPPAVGDSGPYLPPIAVGPPTDPKIAALLSELDAFLQSRGVNLQWFTARELTTMPKAPGDPVAIPDREYWQNMASTIVWAAQPLRATLGLPFSLRGYRPEDYNEAVGGAERSRHQDFGGLDIYIAGSANTSANRKRLALEAARFFVQHGERFGMGFGAYGKPVPSNIHVDVGRSRKSTWRDAQFYIDKVRAIA